MVVGVGNNNLDVDPPHKIADGIIAIGRRFQEALPEVKVLLVGLLPRDEGYSLRRDRQQEVNTSLRNYCQRVDSKGCFYLAPDHRFAPGVDGHLDRTLYWTDLLHLGERGNDLFGRNISERVCSILYGSGGRGNPTLDSYAIGQPESTGATPSHRPPTPPSPMGGTSVPASTAPALPDPIAPA